MKPFVKFNDLCLFLKKSVEKIIECILTVRRRNWRSLPQQQQRCSCALGLAENQIVRRCIVSPYETRRDPSGMHACRGKRGRSDGKMKIKNAAKHSTVFAIDSVRDKRGNRCSARVL